MNNCPGKNNNCCTCEYLILILFNFNKSVASTLIMLLVKVCSGQRDDIRRPCVFPWIDYKTNLTHHGCANPDKDEGGLWCAIETDRDGYWMDYGYCKYCE